MPMQLKEQALETVSSVTLVKEQPVKEMLMLHLISQQLWKLLLFSSGKKASVETLSFLFIKSSSDFFWCSLKCQPTGAKRWLTFRTIITVGRVYQAFFSS